VSILIIGGGTIGATLAKRLSSSESKDVVVVEANDERVRELRDAADVQVIHGSGANPRVLREARLEDAEMLIAVTNSDEVNLVSCLMAARESVIPTKIARIRDPDLAEAVPSIFGEGFLDLNINPEEEAAEAIFETLQVPGATRVLEFAGGRVHVVAFAVDRPCAAVGVPLAALRSKLGVNCNIVAILRDGRLIVPDGAQEIRRGDLLHAAGSQSSLAALAQLLEKERRPARRIMISGGGNISYHLAKRFEAREIAPKIVEADAERCRFLVQRLERSVVLQGHGTDPELLHEENIESTDAFLALTGDEEENILSAFQAKRAHVGTVMALVNKPTYATLAQAIGIDALVSPNAAAVSAILQFIRKGKVLSVTTLGEEGAEALEIVALETSGLVGRPLRACDLKDAHVGAIVRGDHLIIPTGDDVIQVGDHVVIFALRSAIPRLERQMMVRLSYF
jgi:trk system potassium uptake protein